MADINKPKFEMGAWPSAKLETKLDMCRVQRTVNGCNYRHFSQRCERARGITRRRRRREICTRGQAGSSTPYRVPRRDGEGQNAKE